MVAQAVTIKKFHGIFCVAMNSINARTEPCGTLQLTVNGPLRSSHKSLRSVRKVEVKPGRRGTVNRVTVSHDRQQEAIVNRVGGRAEVQKGKWHNLTSIYRSDDVVVDDDDRRQSNDGRPTADCLEDSSLCLSQ